jgi:hypothetical protein
MSGYHRITTKPTPTRKQVEALEEITRPNWNEEVISYFLEKYNVPDLYKKKITSLLEIFIKKEKEYYINKLTSDINYVMNDEDDPVDYSVDENGLFKVIPPNNIYWKPIKRFEYVDQVIFESELGEIIRKKNQFHIDLRQSAGLRTLKSIGKKELQLRDEFNTSVKALCESFGTIECPENPYQYVFGKQQGGKKQSRKKQSRKKQSRKKLKKTYKNTKRVSRK